MVTIKRFFSRVDAVLSQNFIQHAINFIQVYIATFNQARNHLNMTHNATIHFTSIICCFLLFCFRRQTLFTAIVVQGLFLFLALSVAVILRASLYGFFPAVSFSAAKGAAKIIPTCIPGMGKKKDVAMPATGQAVFQMGLFIKNRANNKIILSNKATDLSIVVPTRNKLKMALDLYYKKAKCSLMSLM